MYKIFVTRDVTYKIITYRIMNLYRYVMLAIICTLYFHVNFLPEILYE